MQACATRLLIGVLLGLAVATPAVGGEPSNPSTEIVVNGTKLSFDPETCTEGNGGFPWGLGSVNITIRGHQDGKCLFDYKWEVEGAGNYQVHRVRVPVDSGLVVIEASNRKEDPEHHWSHVFTSFTAKEAELVRRMRFGWFDVPVGEEFASYHQFRAGDAAPPVGRGDKMTLRFLVFLDETFTNPAGAQWHSQLVTTRVGDGGEWQWVQSVAENMTPYETRRVRVPAKIAGPAGRWLPGYQDNSTIYVEMQLVDVERK